MTVPVALPKDDKTIEVELY